VRHFRTVCGVRSIIRSTSPGDSRSPSTKGSFWGVCGLWALLLVSFGLARPYLPNRVVFEPGPKESASILPAVGEQLLLPTHLTTMTEERIPALSAEGRTLFFVLSAGCPACRRELPRFPELLQAMTTGGVAIRTLVIPGTVEDTRWFLDRLPYDAYAVLDTVRLAVTRLRARVSPSAILIAADGTVQGSFSPSGEWPPSQKTVSGTPTQ